MNPWPIVVKDPSYHTLMPLWEDLCTNRFSTWREHFSHHGLIMHSHHTCFGDKMLCGLLKTYVKCRLHIFESNWNPHIQTETVLYAVLYFQYQALLLAVWPIYNYWCFSISPGLMYHVLGLEGKVLGLGLGLEGQVVGLGLWLCVLNSNTGSFLCRIPSPPTRLHCVGDKKTCILIHHPFTYQLLIVTCLSAFFMIYSAICCSLEIML